MRLRNYLLPITFALALLLAGGIFTPANAAGITTPERPALPAEQGILYPYDVVMVTGSGKAAGVPDLAHLNFGVSATAETVAEARTQAAEAMQGMLDTLRDNQIADSDISTSYFSVRQDYSYVNGQRQFLGYVVSNHLNVKVRNTDAVGTVIDAAIAAAGDNTEFHGLSFSFSNTAVMERIARQAAVRDMQTKAQQLAQAAGRELGDLKMLSEITGDSFSSFRGILSDFAAFAPEAAAAPTPIQVGEDEIRVTVYGLYELR